MALLSQSSPLVGVLSNVSSYHQSPQHSTPNAAAPPPPSGNQYPFYNQSATGGSAPPFPPHNAYTSLPIPHGPIPQSAHPTHHHTRSPVLPSPHTMTGGTSLPPPAVSSSLPPSSPSLINQSLHPNDQQQQQIQHPAFVSTQQQQHLPGVSNLPPPGSAQQHHIHPSQYHVNPNQINSGSANLSNGAQGSVHHHHSLHPHVQHQQQQQQMVSQWPPASLHSMHNSMPPPHSSISSHHASHTQGALHHHQANNIITASANTNTIPPYHHSLSSQPQQQHHPLSSSQVPSSLHNATPIGNTATSSPPMSPSLHAHMHPMHHPNSMHTMSSYVANGGVPPPPSSPAAPSSSPMITSSEVAYSFVYQFYTKLHDDPSVMHLFYNSDSQLCRFGESFASLPRNWKAYGQREICSYFERYLTKDTKTFIKVIETQDTIDGGIFVFVTGTLKSTDEFERDFIQSVFLARQQQGDGWYIKNEYFYFISHYNGDFNDINTNQTNYQVDQPSYPYEDTNVQNQKTLGLAQQQLTINNTNNNSSTVNIPVVENIQQQHNGINIDNNNNTSEQLLNTYTTTYSSHTIQTEADQINNNIDSENTAIDGLNTQDSFTQQQALQLNNEGQNNATSYNIQDLNTNIDNTFSYSKTTSTIQDETSSFPQQLTQEITFFEATTQKDIQSNETPSDEGKIISNWNEEVDLKEDKEVDETISQNNNTSVPVSTTTSTTTRQWGETQTTSQEFVTNSADWPKLGETIELNKRESTSNFNNDISSHYDSSSFAFKLMHNVPANNKIGNSSGRRDLQRISSKVGSSEDVSKIGASNGVVLSSVEPTVKAEDNAITEEVITQETVPANEINYKQIRCFNLPGDVSDETIKRSIAQRLKVNDGHVIEIKRPNIELDCKQSAEYLVSEGWWLNGIPMRVEFFGKQRSTQNRRKNRSYQNNNNYNGQQGVGSNSTSNYSYRSHNGGGSTNNNKSFYSKHNNENGNINNRKNNEGNSSRYENNKDNNSSNITQSSQENNHNTNSNNTHWKEGTNNLRRQKERNQGNFNRHPKEHSTNNTSNEYNYSRNNNYRNNQSRPQNNKF